MADACECGNEPSGSVKSGNFLTSCKPVSFSRRTLHHGLSKLIYSFKTVLFENLLIFGCVRNVFNSDF